MLASRSISRETAKAISREKSCQYCCAEIPREARKCRSCGEWVVRTTGGFGAHVLRLIAVCWAAVSVAIAAGAVFVAQAVRRWVWMHSVNPEITPQVIDFALYVVIAMVLLKGLSVSVGLVVMAKLSPRRPAWFS
jgi:ribosomal protein L40E